MQEASSVTVIAHTIVVALTGTFPLAQWKLARLSRFLPKQKTTHHYQFLRPVSSSSRNHDGNL